MTQAELAEKIDRTVFAVSQLERGVSLPSFETLERLSSALDTPVREFFDSASDDRDASPKRIQAIASLMSLVRSLTDGEVETALQHVQVIHANRIKKSGKSR
jgi:transcriptional regulator with XRE-family HTH domain